MNTLETLLQAAKDQENVQAAVHQAVNGYAGLSGLQTFGLLGGFALLGVVVAAVLTARAGR